MTRPDHVGVGGQRGVRGRGRRTGRRSWRAPRCRTARTARAAGRRPGRAARRAGRRSRRRSAPRGAPATSKISASSASSQKRTGVPRKTCQCAHSAPPDLARPRPRSSGPCPTPSASSGDAAGVQQPGHVVVGRHEQARGIPERLVVEQQPRVDVTVRARSSAARAPRRTAAGRSPGRPARRAAAGPGAARARRRCRSCAISCGPLHAEAILPRAIRAAGGENVTQIVAPHAPQAARGRASAEPPRCSPRTQVRAFVRDQLAGADLDGRSVCVLVPDGTRSCPLPLLLSAVHGALHGRVEPPDRARRARHPRAR